MVDIDVVVAFDVDSTEAGELSNHIGDGGTSFSRPHSGYITYHILIPGRWTKLTCPASMRTYEHHGLGDGSWPK